MKRKVEHPEPSARELSGPRYWRSLDELVETPGFQNKLAKEFPEGASNLNGVDRRHFFKLMAASFALGGMGLATGCRRPEANILPYGKSVEGIIPGVPQYYATSFPLRGAALPLLAETHQGRPTKLEGNPSYTPYGGASSLLAQASVLDLYDPDRATTHTTGGAASTVVAMRDKLSAVHAAAAANGGAGLAVLAESSSSPSRARLVEALKGKLPNAMWAEYDAVSDLPPAAAARAAFGQNVKPLYRFAKAKRIVSIDADFFHAESGALGYSRDFAKGRKVLKANDPMNRLYAVESTFSLTGSMADHRLRLASSHMLAFTAALLAKLSGQDSVARLAQGLNFKDQDKWIEACATDLAHHKGECLVVAGAHQPAQVHALAYAINAFLGNIGKTIDFVEVPQNDAASLADLAAAAKAGKVSTLVVLGGNPAYNAPADLDFTALADAVDDVIRYGYYVDETSALADTHIGATHYLESWGDARTADGTIVPVQPMIMPLFDGLTELEVVARLAGADTTDPYSIVFDTVVQYVEGRLLFHGRPANPNIKRSETLGSAQDVFRKFLHDGIIADSAYATATVRYDQAGAGVLFADAPSYPALSKDNLEVRFTFDHKMDDGRYANNGWLQECPDPITKISWDNAILVSPRLGAELGIEPGGAALQVARKELAEYPQGKENAFVGEVTVNGTTVRGPMHIQPGLSNWTIVLPLGYGRQVSGRVGQGAGHDFYPARTSAHPDFVTGATIKVLDERYKMANQQEHWSMEGRDLVREANKEEFDTDPNFVDSFGIESHAPANLGKDKNMPLAAVSVETPRGNSLYETPNFEGTHQWGMSIDLNTCIGCNACVIACQAENNIPIVGKEQVMRGREMHWIRLDRYYSDGNISAGAFGGPKNKVIPEDPQASLMPVACMQCELAPCETVCPVNATVHDDEGLNVMAYNRCIGTRYCANNCPYKVRRFNFFDWNDRSLDQLYMGPAGDKGMPELVQMAKNPDVTVRMRGVMEKCTYCVQRIQQAKIAQKVKARDTDNVVVPDGTIKTACQQVCAVDAIEFGNIKDPESAVSQAKAREQDYALLGYLNIRPRTTYLGKLRNPNPDMPDYASLPLSRIEYNTKNHPAHGDDHGGGSHGEAHPAADDHGHAHDEPDGHTSIMKNALSTGGLS
ncbi:TAT-variant-translocated molybdopterin oxidoreductase [Synoicihabitans lomoniglobus]|uniref:TAT-variant-translocated molybdopterin oxidoreductase n=1 Tax=Synoicihabitans lomoniglobus TaxID=2909285 RepID=A0AAF0CR64_9BACT|nr:TAT-variant-translocated molybdopterin oxidoreductase [Opitutaceae bacterium LMO-M01]WED66471.1 TAT-variant-translocated molybdopterin oxidoreductase [Opitutaceae bacterium LMO-M01]